MERLIAIALMVVLVLFFMVISLIFLIWAYNDYRNSPYNYNENKTKQLLEKPIFKEEKRNVIELKSYFVLPYEHKNRVSQYEIKELLMKDMKEDLIKCMEIEYEYNPRDLSTRYTARLNVINKN